MIVRIGPEEVARAHGEAHANGLHLDDREHRTGGRRDEVAGGVFGDADQTVDGGGDRRVLQVIFRGHERGFRGGLGGLECVERGLRVLHRVHAGGVHFVQHLVAVVGALGIFQFRLEFRDRSLGLLHGRLVLRLLDRVQHLAFLHIVAVVETELQDLAGHARRHVHDRLRDHLPGVTAALDIGNLLDLGDADSLLDRGSGGHLGENWDGNSGKRRGGAGHSRDFAPDIDCRIPRNDSRHHLEYRQMRDDLAFLRPLEFSGEHFVGDRQNREAAADDAKSDLEHFPEESEDFQSHSAPPPRNIARLAHATASYNPSCHVRPSICGTHPNISHRSPSL